MAYVIFPDRIALAEVISGFYVDALEFVAAICVMYLIDRHGGIKGLTLAFLASYEVSDSRDYSKSSNPTSALNLSSNPSKASASNANLATPEPLFTARNASYKESSDTTREVTGTYPKPRAITRSHSH